MMLLSWSLGTLLGTKDSLAVILPYLGISDMYQSYHAYRPGTTSERTEGTGKKHTKCVNNVGHWGHWTSAVQLWSDG